MKARLKFRGLVNISGFHVDPGYRGELVFSVLNAGPTPLHLEEGQELFLIWYSDLDRKTARKKKLSDGFRGIDTQLVNNISGEILSLQSLSEAQRALEKDLRSELAEQKRRVSNLNILLRIFITAVVGLILWQARDLLPPVPPP